MQLSKVLRRVMEGQPEPLSALLLTDEQNGRHGTICISESRYISGAELKDAAYNRISTGYEALKTISELVSANFQYITAPPAFFENTELTLNIEIEKILLCLPNLPKDVSELQSSESLLDRVFSHDEVTAAIPVKIPEPSQPTKKKSTWHSVPVSRAAEVFAEEEAEEFEEPKKKYTTMEQRALEELGPPGVQKMRKKKSWMGKLFRRIGYFFYSLYTAPAHVFRKLAKPVILPIVAIALVYQAWVLFSPMVRGMKVTLIPAAPKHQTSAPPEHVVRSTATYHAPAVHRSSSSSAHAATPTANTITIIQPVVENKPIVPYTTPENPPMYPHRRAYQVVPQAHPSNSNISTTPRSAASPSTNEPPHSVPAANSAEQ